MEVDQYWKIRTVAGAMKDYTCFRLKASCGRITDYPFTLLLQHKGVGVKRQEGTVMKAQRPRWYSLTTMLKV